MPASRETEAAAPQVQGQPEIQIEPKTSKNNLDHLEIKDIKRARDIP